MRTFYPPIEPTDSGLLDVGDGQQIYYEVSGNPDGKPAVYLHGGPGGASSPDQRRVFDPATYRIVLFDQRGCGNSLPHASAPEADLAANTTWHLVADMEALRTHLGIDRWLVCGGSWGSTLALAYAQKHPTCVSELVLRGIFTLRKSELDWFYEGGAASIYPDLWEGFLAPVPEDERGHLMAAYSRLLNDPDPAVHVPAATAWSRWESSAITLLPDQDLIDHFTEDAFAVAFARIENHFFMHGGWCEDGQLIRDATLLRDIPGVIIQGRYDMCTPAVTAWDLHRTWPEAEFKMIPDAGHAFSEPGILDAIIEATDTFAGSAEAARPQTRAGQVDTPRAVGHFEIIGEDPAQLREYFGELFGWEFDTPSPVVPEVSGPDNYGFVDLITTDDGSGIRGGIGGGPGYASHAVFYVGVPSVEEALQRAESLGGTRVMGPATSPTGLVVGHFTDPEGTLIGVAGTA